MECEASTVATHERVLLGTTTALETAAKVVVVEATRHPFRAGQAVDAVPHRSLLIPTDLQMTLGWLVMSYLPLVRITLTMVHQSAQRTAHLASDAYLAARDKALPFIHSIISRERPGCIVQQINPSVRPAPLSQIAERT